MKNIIQMGKIVTGILFLFIAKIDARDLKEDPDRREIKVINKTDVKLYADLTYDKHSHKMAVIKPGKSKILTGTSNPFKSWGLNKLEISELDDAGNIKRSVLSFDPKAGRKYVIFKKGDTYNFCRDKFWNGKTKTCKSGKVGVK